MLRYATTVPSSLTPAEAFARMADVCNFEQWDPGVQRVVHLRSHGSGLGARYELLFRIGRKPNLFEYEVTAYDDGVGFSMVGANRKMTSRDTVSVERRDGGSAVTYRAEVELHGWRRVFTPLAQRSFTRIGRRAEAGLRRFLNP